MPSIDTRRAIQGRDRRLTGSGGATAASAGVAGVILSGAALLAPTIADPSGDPRLEAIATALVGLPLVALVVSGLGALIQRSLTLPQELLTTTLVDGFPATVIRGRTSWGWGALAAGVTSLSCALAAVLAWPSAWVAVALLATSAYLAVWSWYAATGRLGDGTVILTRSGIRQALGGVDGGVRWNSAIALRPHPEGFEIGTLEPVVRKRTAPLLICGRTHDPRQGLVIRTGNLNAELHLICTIAAYVEDLGARSEIGSPFAAERLLGAPMGIGDDLPAVPARAVEDDLGTARGDR